MPKTQSFASVGSVVGDRLLPRKGSNLKKQGVAVCEETRKHGFEAEGGKVTSRSTVTVGGRETSRLQLPKPPNPQILKSPRVGSIFLGVSDWGKI